MTNTWQRRIEIDEYWKMRSLRIPTAEKVHALILQGFSRVDIGHAGGRLANDIGCIRTIRRNLRNIPETRYSQALAAIKRRIKKDRLYANLVRRMRQHFGTPQQSKISESLYFTTPKGKVRVSRHWHNYSQLHQIVILRPQ